MNGQWRLACGAAAAVVCSIAFHGAAAESPVHGPSAHIEQRLEEAVAAYTRAQNQTQRERRVATFARAQQLFSGVAEALPGPSADLYANLGNAALQSQQLGPAVLAYQRALRVDPMHTRARRNLAYARAQLPAWVPRASAASAADSFFFWHRSLSRPDRIGFGAACFAVACGGLAASLRWRKSWVRSLALLPAAGWLMMMGSLAAESSSGEGEAAVVVVGEAILRTSDSALAPRALPDPLPEGTEVSILEVRSLRDQSGWARIRLANSREAWLHTSALATVVRRPESAKSD